MRKLIPRGSLVILAALSMTLLPLVMTLLPFVMVFALAVFALVMRNVHVVEPAFLHKIDPLAACVVLVAVLTPVLGVARGHVQVDGLDYHTHRHRRDDDRLWVNKLRWLSNVADLNVAIEARLTDGDRYRSIGCDTGMATTVIAVQNKKRKRFMFVSFRQC